MRFGSLFAGIGGFDLGLERAGMSCAWQVENNEYCQRVLAKHWPGVPRFGDIRECGGDNLEEVDLICGGYPCQPFSQAGKRKGAADDRHLWPEMFRIIQELRPTWVLGENVAGHISLGLDQTLSDLEAEGYTTRAFVIPACAVDAPHRRGRVWIVASNAGHYRQRQLLGPERQHKAAGRNQHAGRDGENRDVADTNGEQARRPAKPRRESHLWPPEPRVGRVAHGVSRRVDRLKCLGNAVVPQVVEAIGRAIMGAWQES